MSAGALGGFSYLLDLASHFQVQYLVCALLSTIYFAYRRQRWWGGAAGLMLLITALQVLPWYVGSADAPTAADSKIMMVNVWTQNPQRHRVAAAIRDADPDIVVLLEVSESWLAELDLGASYPYVHEEPRSDNFGIALYSRLPLRHLRTEYLGSTVPTIVAQADVNGKEITLVATHPLPAVSAEYASARDSQLEAVVDAYGESAAPLLLIGDLNISMWSPIYRRVFGKSGLRNTRESFGVMASWQRGSLLQIPIDMALCDPRILVSTCAIGPELGSDHRPLIVEFR